MDCSACLPQSVFNTQSSNMVKYLEQCRTSGATQLEQYQVDAVLRLRGYFDNDPQINHSNSNIAIVSLPTGCDSNGVAVMAPYALNASRVVVLTSSLVAAQQVNKSFSTFLLEHGVIKDKDKQKILPSQSIVTNDSQLSEAMTVSVAIINASKTGGKSSVKITDIPSDNNDFVIVIDAQYYTESTWQLIANHFTPNRLLFLSTTGQHNGRLILKNIHPCYELQHSEAVNRGIIRDVQFDKPVGGDDKYAYLSTVVRVQYYLNAHDTEEPSVAHQAIILVQTASTANSISDYYNKFYPGNCAIYLNNSQQDIFERFVRGEVRTIVTTIELLDGFNHSSVSVLGVAFTISHSSRPVFGRSVVTVLHKSSPSDPVVAQVISHERFHQVRILNVFEKIAEVDPSEE